MKEKFINFILLLVLFLSTLNLILDVSASTSADCPCKNISIYFFYGEGCPHCTAVEPIVKATCEQCNISFESYEVYHNASNQKILNDFGERYCIHRDELGVPAIFVGDTALIGDKSIAENLKNAIASAKEKGIDAKTYRKNCTVSQSPELPTIATVIGAAIIDSINPCAMGVLIIFISFMISSLKFSRKRIAIYGAIYIICVYITYFLAGLGILKFLNFINNIGFIIFVDALIVIILLIGVFLAFRDAYVSLKKENKKKYLSIPASTKGILEKFIKKGTFIAIIILGVIVAMVELPCTGQVYLGILTVLNTMDFNYGILLLAIYNLIFVLPLIIILSLGLSGRNLSKISEKKTEESWIVRYLIGWVMIILSVILIDEIFKFLNFSIVFQIPFSYEQFFIIAVISIVVLFIIFSILRPIVKKRINIWYCAFCYACALTWISLAILYILGTDVPKILIAGLIGMSLAGIWEEFKKFNFKYFGLFTMFITIFGIVLIYALLIDYKFGFLLLVLLLFMMDGIIVLKNFEIERIYKKEKISNELTEETKKEVKEVKEETKNLRERLDHCCD